MCSRYGNDKWKKRNELNVGHFCIFLFNNSVGGSIFPHVYAILFPLLQAELFKSNGSKICSKAPDTVSPKIPTKKQLPFT